MCRGRQRFASGRPAYLRRCTCRACVNEVCVCVCVALQRLRHAMRHGMSVRSSSTAPQLAAHLNCEFECLNCILFVANSLLQQLKANFAALHHPIPVSLPCSTAMTAGSALGFLINAAGGDIHRTWQQAAKSKQRRASSKRQGALRTELLSRFFFISALRQKLLDIFLMWGAEIKAGGGGRRKN